MNRFFIHMLIAAALSASGSARADVPKAGSHPPAARAPDRADDLFEQAANAFDAGRYAEAQSKLEAAWSLKKTYDIAGNLGVVEVKLGKYALAAEHLSWALDHFPPTETMKARRGYEQELQKARAQVGALRVRVTVEGAELSVNGRAAGTTPVAGELFVEPGRVTLVARRDGFNEAQEVLTVGKGEAREITMSLVAVSKRSVVPGAVLGGIAGAALLSGIGLYAGGRSKASSASELHDAILGAGHSCVTGAANYDAKCADLKSTGSTSNTLQQAGVGLLIGASAAAIGTVIYFVLPQPSPGGSKQGSLRITPSATSSTAGLVFSGTF